MSIWDDARKWFQREEKTDYDREEMDKRYEEFVDRLIERNDYVAKRKKDKYYNMLDEYLPDVVKAEYKEFDERGDSEIESMVGDKLKDKHAETLKEIGDKYDAKSKAAENEIEKAKNKAIESSDKLDAGKEDSLNAFKDKAQRNGIRNSSIMSAISEEIENDYDGRIEKTLREYENTIKTLTDKLIALENEREGATDKAERENAEELTREYAKELKKRDDYNEKIKEHNRKEDIKAEDSEQRRLDARTRFDKWYDSEIKRIEENEMKYGYTQQKEKDYQERLDYAKSFYNSMPKELAREYIKQDGRLAGLLGDKYAEFIRYVNE